MSAPFRLWPLILALLLHGCSLLPQDEDETLGWSAQKLFTSANYAMEQGDFEEAIKYFEALEARYPFGVQAMQSQLNIAYAYYKYDEPDSAIAAADRFLKLYPNHPAAAYAMYLKGLANFERGKGLFDRILPVDPSQRDPGAARDSFRDFAELVRRFPDSEYAGDAMRRMLFLRNNLARHEIHVANYYMKRGAYLAAANRAVYVVENYQRTPSVRDALLLMVDAYDRLGLPALSADAQRVLALNEERGTFGPDRVTPEDERSWAQQVWEYLELDKN
jgi:outer membrane protein assembly factor BamD